MRRSYEPGRILPRAAARPFGLRGMFLAAWALLATCLCILAPAAYAAAEGTRPRIGIALPSYKDSRWALDLQAARVGTENAGADLLVRFAGNNQDQQNIQIKEMVNTGVTALLVVPSDTQQVAPAIEFAKQRGVIVISYDRLAQNCNVDAYITFDRFRPGELAADYLATRAPKGNYVLIFGPATDGSAARFKERVLNSLHPLIQAGDITVVAEGSATNWKTEAAKAIMEKALHKTTNITAVLAPNDDIAGVVIDVLKANGLAGKVLVTGQDATPAAMQRIHTGTQAMTVFKDTHLLARKGMLVIQGLLRGTPEEADGVIDNGKQGVPTYIVPVMAVDRESLHWLTRHLDSH